ncbi:hypothetical protein IFM89_003967, partial [Coptis chinensis]
MVGGGTLLQRAVSYVVDKVVVDSLANSHTFQRFAVRTSKGLENVSKRLGDVSQLAEQKKQEAAEFLEYVTKTFDESSCALFGEAKWIGWAGANVPDKIGQRALSNAFEK